MGEAEEATAHVYRSSLHQQLQGIGHSGSQWDDESAFHRPHLPAKTSEDIRPQHGTPGNVR